MTIRTRLTVLFTAVVSILLLLFCIVIYFLVERHRHNQFYERLRAEATTSAELLFGKETLSPELFKLLDKNHLTVLNEEELIIYDYRDSLVYESGTDYLRVDKTILNRVRLENEIRWNEGPREVVGVLFADQYNRFVVFASAIDKYGYGDVSNLLWVLGIGWMFSSFIVFLVGWFYAYRALLPLKKLIGRVDAITASRLDLRVDVGDTRDEIGQLAERFNRMLDRLEEAFQLQRAFVSNASHELRTPLTAITGQIEVALMDDNPQEWQDTLRSVLDDARQLNRLSNGLLSLAKVSMEESAVKLSEVYLDEIFWQVRSELLKAYPRYIIKVDLANFSNESTHFSVLGNEPLLLIALTNLLENGAKFSPDNTVEVRFQQVSNVVEIHFYNRGPAIPEEELPLIFKPFRRGSNARTVAGHGIGLSLTERIIKLHQGLLSVESIPDQGTTFVISLPKKS
ncbi:HAMP domain-containing sensor histidine kinase [Runella slithyformis]|uniref:histidine kinase n=1 Tax=Runella slithyformis (strain ATCC 29530 / DSM 19594 / LMG 11500 / NCIMB 11436 / LSU 4) TaxID=761193 RepID=A0A7U4E6X0_RUNSL|nr:ATP-binding protein [Runella slithyformis]AEI50058.1 integral membrane sensor signal transduction histidine kinase [Runella slithyformis DSM 19594]